MGVLNPPMLPGGTGANRPRRHRDASKGQIRDDRTSTCKNCGWGIFIGDGKRWSRQPLGLVHDPVCPDRVGAALAKTGLGGLACGSQTPISARRPR